MRDQAEFQVRLLGGDTTRSNGPLSLTITAYGSTNQPLLRSGAKAGDSIYVSGAIGAGYLGLHDHSAQTIAHYERPKPRLALGQQLRSVATACMDISDGLMQDLGHLCAASGVGADVILSDIPLADASYDAISQITGGDDYELLFTTPPNAQIPAGATRIGQISETTELRVLDEKGKPLKIAQSGWQHF